MSTAKCEVCGAICDAHPSGNWCTACLAAYPVVTSAYGTGPDDFSEAEPERIAVTEEMIAAGAQYVGSSHSAPASNQYWADKIYRAMAAVAPGNDLAASNDRLVYAWHRAEHRANAATTERDAALARADAAENKRDEYYEALSRVVSKLMDAQKRLGERDASLLRATGKR